MTVAAGDRGRDMMRRLAAAATLVAAILSTALLELAINPNLFVTPGLNGMIDPWVYTGFFLSLPSFLRMFPETYYGSRLSVLLPGFLAHGMFPPLVASYVLHLTLYCLLLSATYGLVRSGASRFARCVASASSRTCISGRPARRA